jgi:hypothetical protein
LPLERKMRCMKRHFALFLVACLVLSSAPALAQPVTQMVSGSLTDGRPQEWAVDSQGDLWTRCKQTTDPNSDWTQWSSFPTPSSLIQVVVGQLTDGRMQLFALDKGGGLWTMCEQTTDPNSVWTPWFSFPIPGITLNRIDLSHLSDGRLQLWAVDSLGRLWTTCKQTIDPNANWTPWSSFQTPANLSVSPRSPELLPHYTNLVLSTPNKRIVVTKNESHRNESRNEEIKKAKFY